MASPYPEHEPVERTIDYDEPAGADRTHTESPPLLNQGEIGNVETSSPTSPSEPSSAPRTLGRLRLATLCIQIVLTILPILFIGLAATAISLHKKQVSQKGRTVQQAITVSPTIFPIIFAAITGRFFRAIGSFGAERGIRLGTLEQLIGSQSLFAAIEKQIALRSQWLLGIPMVAFWALSPLGGQSALRLLQVSPTSVSTDASVRYLPKEAGQAMTAFSGASGASISWPSYASIYMTALTTTQRQWSSSQDLFGNVRIPSYDSLALGPTNGNWSWITVDHSQDVHYSAILGIPVVGIPATGNLTFGVISRYYAADCNNATVLQDGQEQANGSIFFAQFRSSEYVSNWYLELYSPNGPDGSNVSFVNCTVAPRNVESNVSCSDQFCRVDAMRNLTVKADNGLTFSNLRIATDSLADATTGPHPHKSRMTSSQTEIWLQNPHSTYVALAFGEFSNLSQVPLQNLSRNVETLFNTFWQSSFGASYLFGNLSTNMSQYDNVDASVPPISFNTSQTTIFSYSDEHYICNMTFASFLLIISCLLFLAGVATTFLMSMTLAPDTLGYISSYTRDNPFASVDQASHLDSLDRARALRNVRVTLGDTNIGSEPGHIAFCATAKVQRLRKGRFYD